MPHQALSLASMDTSVGVKLSNYSKLSQIPCMGQFLLIPNERKSIIIVKEVYYTLSSPSLPPSPPPSSLDCLKWLVQHAEGDPYIAAEDGMSAIHAAAQAGQLPCLRWLVEEAAVPVRSRSADGATPAHFAAASGEVWCVCVCVCVHVWGYV